MFDYEGNIYDSEIKLYFRAFMREEKKFDSVEQLQQHLTYDKEKAIEILRDFR
jgi:riboflavin kinase/FMN adenylyltransferase